MALLLAANWRLGGRKLLYPPLIFSGIWLLTAIALAVSPIDLDPIHAETLLIVLTAAVCFSIGGACSRFFLLKGGVALRRHAAYTRTALNDYLRVAAMLALLVILPLFIRQFFSSAGAGGLSALLSGARAAAIDAASEGRGKIDFLALFPVGATLLFFVQFAEDKGTLGDKVFTRVILFFALFGVILTTGRTGFVELAGGYLLIHTIKSGQYHPVRYSLVALSLLIAMVIMFFLAKDVPLTGTWEDVVALRDHLFTYACGPIAAFDKVVVEPGSLLANNDSNHTLSSVLRYSNIFLGTSFPLPPVLDEYCFVPFATNVYTVLKFYFVDFGVAGLLLIMSGIGFIHTRIYLKALQGDPLYITMAAVLMFPLAMVAFDDHYYQLIGYLRVYLELYVYFRIVPKLFKKRLRAQGARMVGSPALVEEKV